MLKPLIILPIVPSRYWLLTQCSLFVGLATLGYWVGGVLTFLAVAVLGGGHGWRAYLRQPKKQLYITSSASLLHARWLQERGQQGHALELSNEYQLRCDYLGPWLIGLYVGKQRLWLWPDSAPSESLREVRKWFHRPGR